MILSNSSALYSCIYCGAIGSEKNQIYPIWAQYTYDQTAADTNLKVCSSCLHHVKSEDIHSLIMKKMGWTGMYSWSWKEKEAWYTLAP